MRNLSFKVTKSLIWLMLGGNFDDDYFQESHESSQFRQEYEMRKMKQASDLSLTKNKKQKKKSDLLSRCARVFSSLMLALVVLIYMIVYLNVNQEQGLDMISEGLDALKNMASDMNEVSLFNCIC